MSKQCVLPASCIPEVVSVVGFLHEVYNALDGKRSWMSQVVFVGTAYEVHYCRAFRVVRVEIGQGGNHVCSPPRWCPSCVILWH